MNDRISKIRLQPNFTAEFIAGVCYGHSDESGEVVAVIRSIDGQPKLELKRERIDSSLPVFLRRQGD